MLRFMFYSSMWHGRTWPWLVKESINQSINPSIDRQCRGRNCSRFIPVCSWWNCCLSSWNVNIWILVFFVGIDRLSLSMASTSPALHCQSPVDAERRGMPAEDSRPLWRCHAEDNDPFRSLPRSVRPHSGSTPGISCAATTARANERSVLDDTLRRNDPTGLVQSRP